MSDQARSPAHAISDPRMKIIHMRGARGLAENNARPSPSCVMLVGLEPSAPGMMLRKTVVPGRVPSVIHNSHPRRGSQAPKTACESADASIATSSDSALEEVASINVSPDIADRQVQETARKRCHVDRMGQPFMFWVRQDADQTA
ncbi:MAG: hypothetical protein ACK4NW_04180 [Roseinatronobacter sp.]